MNSHHGRQRFDLQTVILHINAASVETVVQLHGVAAAYAASQHTVHQRHGTRSACAHDLGL